MRTTLRGRPIRRPFSFRIGFMRGLWCVVVLALLGSSGEAGAQAGDTLPPVGEWVQPYRQLPGYWELIGRVVGDVPGVRQDRRYRGFLDPSVLIAGSIRESTKEGGTIGTFNRMQSIQADNVLNSELPPDRLVTAELTQVRFTALEGSAVRLEVRTGTPSSEFQQCVDARHTKFAHLLDIRMQAVTLCDGALFWLPWRPQATVMLDASRRGTLTLEHIGVLVVTLDQAAGELHAIVRVP